QIIRKQFPTATLHLYGIGFGIDGPAHHWALAQRLEENIEFNGVIDFKELMNALSSYNILVHTAREETFGNILAEAMAQGIPVVGGNKSGAVPEVVGTNGKAGFLVDITSSEKVAEAVLKILSTEKMYNQFSRNARDEALRKFKAEDTVAAYEKIYVNLLNEI
ncbi:MAG: glycosyltransferase family 4 protein, partial [Ginsengibacter sp.]